VPERRRAAAVLAHAPAVRLDVLLAVPPEAVLRQAASAVAVRPEARMLRRRRRHLPHRPHLRGRYLGLIRQIPANKRGQYQKIAKDSGREAAINAMKSAVNR